MAVTATSRRFDPGRGELRAILHDITGWNEKDQDALAEYLAAHVTLPEHPEEISEEEIGLRATTLDGDDDVEKKVVLVLFAHHKSARAINELRRYVMKAEPEMRRFARLALEEAEQWMEPVEPLRNGPCPCNSGRRFKACCGRKHA